MFNTKYMSKHFAPSEGETKDKIEIWIDQGQTAVRLEVNYN